MTLSVRVQRITQETPQVRTFELVAASAHELPPFSAGAHIDVRLPNGLVRPYSLCNDPGQRGVYCIGVKREPQSRGGSAYLHERVREGDILDIGAPRHQFSLAPAASHHLLLGAGIGITPLMAMAHTLAAQGASFELHDFVRSQDLVAFQTILAQAPFSGRVHFHIGLSTEQVVGALDQALATRPDGAHLYLCGPRPFMAVARATAAAAWPDTSIHFEYFTADTSTVSAAADSFTVCLARSGGTYKVPADRSIVEVLGMHGIEIFTSCEQGVCGTCLTRVVQGIPDHRDSYLTDPERQRGDTLLPCVSRACSPVLVLDL